VRPAGIDRGEQRIRTAALHGDGGHHGNAKLGGHARDVDGNAAPFRGVDEVQNHQHRLAQRLQLQHEAQVQAQVGGIDDAEQQIRRRFTGIEAAKEVAGHRFVEAGRLQAVGTGQIKDRQLATRRKPRATFLALDGDAGVVGHLLPAAGDAVEQRGLAAVRIADERGAHHGCAALLSASRTRAASTRRSAKRVPAICTSSGSPPKGPRVTTRTGSPATKPSSRKRRAIVSLAWTSSTAATVAELPVGRSSRVMGWSMRIVLIVDISITARRLDRQRRRGGRSR
jgi:hypothetical protein